MTNYLTPNASEHTKALNASLIDRTNALRRAKAITRAIPYTRAQFIARGWPYDAAHELARIHLEHETP